MAVTPYYDLRFVYFLTKRWPSLESEQDLQLVQPRCSEDELSAGISDFLLTKTTIVNLIISFHILVLVQLRGMRHLSDLWFLYRSAVNAASASNYCRFWRTCETVTLLLWECWLLTDLHSRTSGESRDNRGFRNMQICRHLTALASAHKVRR